MVVRKARKSVSERRSGCDRRPALSAEIFVIPLDDRKYVIYAPLRQSAFVGNDYVAEYIRRLQRGEWRADSRDAPLVELLRSLEMVDAGPEGRPCRLFRGEPSPTSVTLFLATACNLRCGYCYASAGNRRPGNMSLSTAQRGIAFAASNATSSPGRKLDVCYHGGGEATVNWKVLTASVEYARTKAQELGLSLGIILTTNGVLSEEQREWVRANVTNLTISCDGIPTIHDRHRKDCSGLATSGRVYETLEFMDRGNVRYGIRVTVTADALDFLPESVEFLTSRFRPEALQVEPVYQLGRARSASNAESEAFVQAFRLARDQAAANGSCLSFSGARVGSLTNHFCSATQDNFCLSADRNVSACYEAFAEDVPCASIFFYGRPATNHQGYEFDLDTLDHLRSQAVENRAFCKDCFAKWSCGGDCYYKWRATSQSLEFDGSPRCHIIRELTKDQILEKIAKAGVAFWRGGDQAGDHSRAGTRD